MLRSAKVMFADENTFSHSATDASILHYTPSGNREASALQSGQANRSYKADDTFSCRVMVQNHPLIVNHLHTRDANYEGYAISKNGLTLVAKI